jgi:hypothetical protein
MARPAMKKTKWTLSFDARLKSLVVRAARRRGVYPVTLLEEIVRDRFNPYGHTDVEDSAAYVAALRKESRRQSDEDFLAELREWQR